MTLKRLADPKTGELCPDYVAAGRCNCSHGGGSSCALRPTPAPARRPIYPPRRRGWYREAVVRSGKLAGQGRLDDPAPAAPAPDPIPEGHLF